MVDGLRETVLGADTDGRSAQEIARRLQAMIVENPIAESGEIKSQI